MIEELKYCPFCGKKPALVTEWKYGERSQVECSCGAKGPKALPEDTKLAIDKWNSRFPENAIDAVQNAFLSGKPVVEYPSGDKQTLNWGEYPDNVRRFGRLIETAECEGRIISETKSYLIVFDLSHKEVCVHVEDCQWWNLDKPVEWNDEDEEAWLRYLAERAT